MSARGARATSTGAAREQGPEPVMSKSKKAPHLAAVEAAADSASVTAPARSPSTRSPSWSATRPLLRIDCVRMLAVAKSGHLDSSLSAADIVAALYYRVLRHDPERPNWPGRDRFVLSQGPRGADPVRGAGPPRLLPARGPDGPAQARRPPPGPSGHDAHARGRGVDRIARPGSVDVASGSRSACGWTGSTMRTCSRCCPTATARRARPGRPRWRPPTSASRT